MNDDNLVPMISDYDYDTVSLHLTPDNIQRIEMLADASGLSVTNFVNQFLEIYLADQYAVLNAIDKQRKKLLIF